MNLTIEIFLDAWHEAGKVVVEHDAGGYNSPSKMNYDIDYFVQQASIDAVKNEVADRRAASVNDPVDLENRHRETWPPFLLDLMPQGHARRKLTEHLGIPVDARSSDLPLLLRAAGSPIGNVRVKEAAIAEAERLENIVRLGVTENDIFGRSDRFYEVVERFGMLASGSSGLQGEWPKVALTLASDGLYYPDALVSDEEAVQHAIVKLVRGNDPADRFILEGEAIYSQIAAEIGLQVHERSTYANGVLFIPRFDRRVRAGGGVERLGQESIVSATGIADFGYIATHERYLGVIARYSAEPYADLAEYVKREIANQALGNPDNHGRNTALSKHVDGTVRLSPLFDFAPMRLSPDGVVRSTRWEVMRRTHQDHLPDWRVICHTIFPEQADQADRLLGDLVEFAERLEHAPQMAVDFGAPKEIVEGAMGRCIEIASSVKEHAAISAPRR